MINPPLAKLALLCLAIVSLHSTPASAAEPQLLECPVTIQATFRTNKVTTSTKGSTTTAKVTTVEAKLAQKDVIKELVSTGVLPSPASNWQLFAVRPLAADLAFINAEFALYAYNSKTRTQVAIPLGKLSSSAITFGYAEYTEQHQGQYIYSSKGKVTSLTSVTYDAQFQAKGGPRVNVFLTDTQGFGTLNYASQNLGGVLVLGVTSVNVNAVGTYSGLTTPGSQFTEGLVNITLSAGASRLVGASKYPEVDPLP